MDLYDLLLQTKHSPVAQLNRAVVLAQLGNIETAIMSILFIPGIDRLLRTDHLYSAILGKLYKRLSNTVKAKKYLTHAQHLTKSFAEKRLLQLRLDELLKMKN